MRWPGLPRMRGVAEFDELSAHDRAEVVYAIRRRNIRLALAVVPVLAAGFVLVLCVILTTLAFAQGIEIWKEQLRPLQGGWIESLLAVVFGLSSAACIGYPPFLAGAWADHLLTKSALQKVVRNRGCLFCGYSLLGIERAADGVRCPECGKISKYRA
ncbi:MAG: hypothetical protein ACREJD_12800 [Phycisphaerales bacterium]